MQKIPGTALGLARRPAEGQAGQYPRHLLAPWDGTDLQEIQEVLGLARQVEDFSVYIQVPRP